VLVQKCLHALELYSWYSYVHVSLWHYCEDLNDRISTDLLCIYC